MLRITGPYRSCPGRLRPIAGGLPLKMILALLLAACTLQLSAHQVSASVSASLSPASPASPVHRYLHKRGAVRRAERRAARRCGCLQLTPFGVVVLFLERSFWPLPAQPWQRWGLSASVGHRSQRRGYFPHRRFLKFTGCRLPRQFVFLGLF